MVKSPQEVGNLGIVGSGKHLILTNLGIRFLPDWTCV